MLNRLKPRGYPAVPDLVIGGNDAISVLADSNFSTTNHIRFVEALSERLRIDLSATLSVMRVLPLWADEKKHIDLRRETAQFLNEGSNLKLMRASSRIDRIMDEKLIGSQIDLLDVVRSSVDVFVHEITGVPPIEKSLEDMPSVFSSNLGISARLRLECALREQIALMGGLFPNETDRQHLIRIGQWAMGRDALVGMLCLSLHHFLVDIKGKNLNLTSLPVMPTHTSIPAIGRIAKDDNSVAGCPVSSGALIECRLDTLSHAPERLHRHFFGAGSHVCLGRTLALDFISIFTEKFSALDFSLVPVRFELLRHDVFDIPQVFVVRKK